ncbi:tail fiber protein [Tistrella mobilis]|uniref:phage tail protein n=1 Tax=Tistrella mobilis TaxID=171437 RepID=UPI0031F69285
MSDLLAYLGEIRLFAHNKIPDNWAVCDGSLIGITANPALFTLLGKAFGGDALNFALPDLRGRAIIGAAPAGRGETGGSEQVTVTVETLPPHTHPVAAVSAPADAVNPAGAYLAEPTPQSSSLPAGPPVWKPDPAALTALHPMTVTSTGADLPHENRQPYIVLSYCICTNGPYPSRSS